MNTNEQPHEDKIMKKNILDFILNKNTYKSIKDKITSNMKKIKNDSLNHGNNHQYRIRGKHRRHKKKLHI